jgi:starch-binding outer membrane protein, SusD/RagB family
MNRIEMRGAAAALVLAFAAAAGCDSLLDVDQPGQITDGQIDEALVASLVAAAEGEYHVAFNWVGNSGAASTDEAIFAHGWSPWEDFDERDLTPAAPAHDGIGYGWMQRARVAGVRSAARLKEMNAPAAAQARALAYAGYSTVLLADYLCQVPLNGGPLLERGAVYDSAIGLFQQAATAAGSDRSLSDLANVGIARSYLNRNDLNRAIEYAKKVEPSFQAWVRFVDSDNFGDWVDKYNLYYRTSGFISPSEFSLALDPTEWAAKRDLRVPFEVDSMRRMFTSVPFARSGYVPFIPSSFEGWTPGNTKTIPGGADIRFASGLEAQYIIAEASLYGGTGGWSDAQVRAFIDARRAVGGHGPYLGTDLRAELREQRKMDLFFAGYRMPDLIRYKQFYAVDLWPKGKMGGYPSVAPYQYGATECWPVGLSEASTNPNF